jgi:predicted ArsR family transcriptional regulator
LSKGRKLRVPAISKGLDCSARTARRELAALKAEGLIEFVGAPKTGYYRLATP